MQEVHCDSGVAVSFVELQFAMPNQESSRSLSEKGMMMAQKVERERVNQEAIQVVTQCLEC
jgi:hypothetical protein